MVLLAKDSFENACISHLSERRKVLAEVNFSIKKLKKAKIIKLYF